MEERPWWPKGIVQTHDSDSISTSWGTLPLHIPEVSIEWWNSLQKTWGEWPEVTEFNLLEENKSGIWYDIGEYKALVIPIPTGKHASRLSRNPQLKSALKDHLQLPIAGCDNDGDHVLLQKSICVANFTTSLSPQTADLSTANHLHLQQKILG